MNLLKLLATLSLDSKEYEDGVKEASNSIASFGNVFGTVMKAGVAAMTVAGGAVVAFGKKAVDSYANYEQLAGGVEKLFGDASDEIMRFANDAYKTSGMSANSYLETATGFSAAMIKSLNGDTAEAARITDIAMRAMSDNVNTFGTDMSAVQNAFMGLSRQNYTMLDNLKLGYAGTAQGMLELVNDSGVLGKKLKSTSDLANVGFADMVLAIQKVQEQQNIAGTTAKEAMTTIEGSANATRAAWENVILAIGKGEGLNEAFDGMLTVLMGDESGGGLINNIIPRVKSVMEGIGNFVAKAGPMIAGRVPELIASIAPPLLEATVSLVMSLGQTISNTVSQLFPLVMENGLALMQKLASGFSSGIPEFLSQALPMLVSFTGEIRQNIGNVVDAGIEVIYSLVDGLINALPDLIEFVPQIITNIAGIINDNMPKIFGMGVEIIGKLINGLLQNMPNLLSNMGNILMAAWNVITAINWLSLGSHVLNSIVNGIKSLGASLPGTLKSIAQNGWNAIKEINWKSIGANIITGIVDGIKSFGSMIKNTLMGLVEGAWKSVKKFFGISSPSKLMRDTIGRFIPEGIAVGIEANAGSLYDTMDELSNMTVDAYNPDFKAVKLDSNIPASDNSLIVSEIKALKDAVLGMQIVLDTGATVGGLAYAMDSELGTITGYKQRGN